MKQYALIILSRSGLFGVLFGVFILTLAGCQKSQPDSAAEAPPSTPPVLESGSSTSVTVQNPGRFQLASTISRNVIDTTHVTGSVNPDVSREIPIVPLANGRVVALHVTLGQTVHRGELLMDVQSPDVATAFGTYLKAVSDEHLAKVTLERDKLLYSKGAIAQTQLEQAQNGEEDAVAGLTAAEQELKILGVDKNHPSDTLHVYSPVNGIVVAQNATAAAAVGITYAGNQGSLLIADLSHVWVICDVYENELAKVHLGQHADIRINAYPGKVFSGTISDIGAILDPNLRTAKVRIQVNNPGTELRIGMFVTATLSSARAAQVVAVPSAAVLHLHDREYVYVPGGAQGTFRRVNIKSGSQLDGNMTEVMAGLTLGQQVVANALDLQNTADQ